MNTVKGTVDVANGLPCHWCVNYQWIYSRLLNPRIIEPSNKRTFGLSIHFRWKGRRTIIWRKGFVKKWVLSLGWKREAQLAEELNEMKWSNSFEH